ncbi:hypothetical protein HB777_11050 [Mesorhizobium loti]|jgi:hypothetical protein|nr:hypothetical protein HB777_11050 [Mesorhizobium loti]
MSDVDFEMAGFPAISFGAASTVQAHEIHKPLTYGPSKRWFGSQTGYDFRVG